MEERLGERREERGEGDEGEFARSGIGRWREGGEWGTGLSSSLLSLTGPGSRAVRLGSDAALSRDDEALSDMTERASYIEEYKEGGEKGRKEVEGK